MNAVQNGYRLFLIEITAAGFQKRKEFALGTVPQINSVGQNLFRTSNLIGSCWPKAVLFQSWGSLLVLFGLGLSIVF